MKTINFNSNQFSYLSKEVSDVMNEANLLLINHKAKSFGIDNKILAEIENARNLVADSLKLKPQEVFFSNGNSNSDIEIINNAILFLKVTYIYTSIFENSIKLEYLKSLQVAGRINLIFIETTEFGEINLLELKNMLSKTESKSLLSLSHANLYTGVLLPVKDISSICQANNTYFHLDLSLTIGRYSIDLQHLKPDFANFDSSFLNGPTSIGIQILKDKIEAENPVYHAIVNNFKTSENKNLAQIMGFHRAYSLTLENLDNNKLKITKLKQYLIEKLNSKLNLKPFCSENKKQGLLNFIPLYIDKNIYGDYLIERLDLKGIFIQELIYPSDLESYNNHYFIGITLNEGVGEGDVDCFVEIMDGFKK